MERRPSVRDRLRRVVGRLRSDPESGRNPPAAPALLGAFSAAHPAATFVEIGANDGEQHDFLRPLILEQAWTGVMVEPVPYVFERLVANYGQIGRVALERAAIGDPGSPQRFHYLRDVSPEERVLLPDWYDGIGSFDRQNILDHAEYIPDLEERLVSADVPVMSFDQLCQKHALDHVDAIVIDTEGYDWQVLEAIDLDRWEPKLVIFEHYHLDEASESAALRYLSESGYVLFREGFDTFALHSSESSELTDAFRSATPAAPAMRRDRPATA